MARRQATSHKPPKLPKHRPGQAGGARDLNRRDNLRRLHDAALALFLAEGTAAVTIDQIVGAAGVAKGSFYRYVADKAELVGHIITPVASEITQAIDRCATALRGARTETLAGIYLRLAIELSTVIARHPSQVLLYLQEARAPRSRVGARAPAVALRSPHGPEPGRELVRDPAVVRSRDGHARAVRRHGEGEEGPAARGRHRARRRRRLRRTRHLKCIARRNPRRKRCWSSSARVCRFRA